MPRGVKASGDEREADSFNKQRPLRAPSGRISHGDCPMATATSTTSSFFTTPRPSLTRPRPSLGNSTINNNPSEPTRASSSYASTIRPGLPATATAKTSVSTVRSATGRKSLQPRLSSGPLSTVDDGNAGYGPGVTHDSNSGPSAMQPLSSPSMNRTVNGDKVGNQNLEVGDVVDVPGGMHGTVKFIGEVRGKKGIFAGVELSREWAARGKNDGDVEGTRYFNTSIPGSGIFLPSSKAYRRNSPTITNDTFPQTPTNPSLAAFNLGGRAPNSTQTPPTPSVSKLSQSIGPGRAPSPAFRPRSRPSLPRPESPLRKAQNVTSTPHGRPSLGAPKFSKTGVNTARYAPSPTPGKFGSSMRAGKDPIVADPGKRHGQIMKPDGRLMARPQSRSQSRLGPDPMFDEELLESTSIGIAKTTYGVREVQHKSRPASGDDGELQSLRLQLEERDRQLEEQTASLADMEKSISELQSSMSKRSSLSAARRSRSSGVDEMDASQLRILLREKNEKIAMLTADFDAHRADFRSTIDTLEMASTETERVYERKVEDLTQEIRELQDRGEDVESVAQQLKQLEELVQELEEGLEDARRGEAEARGEVEFLRGEVERGRSELRREREKAAAAMKGAGAVTDGDKVTNASSREVEQRDDEIRGLKAIIHSLSRDAVPDMNGSRRGSKPRPSNGGPVNGYNDDKLAEERHAREILEREVKELEGLVDRKTYREEELEHEIERLRSAVAVNNHNHVRSVSNGFSERTIVPSKRSSGRDSKGPLPEAQLESMPEIDDRSSTTDCSHLWCEICDAPGHDILTCTNVFVTSKHNTPTKAQPPPAPRHTKTSSESLSQRTGRDVVAEGLKGLSMSTPPPSAKADNEQQDRITSQQQRSPAAPAPASNTKTLDPTDDNTINMAPGKASGIIDASKWCALCERDGHESVDCPFDVDY